MTIGFASKKLLAIDWDRRNLRLVLVRPRGDGIELLKAISVPIPPGLAMDEAESLGAFVREAMRQARMGVKRAMVSIPRDQVVLNTLNVPPSTAEELPSIVQLQIVKELPFAADQATLDFAVSGGFDPKEASNVLVAAVRNEQLDFYRKVAHEAGLKVERIGLRPHANLIAVLTKAPELQDQSLLLVEVGPHLTEIDIIRKGALAFSRAASVALPEAEGAGRDRLDDSRIESVAIEDRASDAAGQQAVGELMVEVIRSFEAFRATDPEAGVDRIVVCGATGIEAQLAESLAARFGAQASLYAPERSLNLSPQRARELRGFSAALGLAIGHGGKGLTHFDFLHPKKPISRRTVRLKKVPIAVATAILFIASGVVFHTKYIGPLQETVANVKDRVNKKKKVERAVRDFKKQVEAVEDWQKSEQYWPDVLVALTDVFPQEQEAFVTRVDFETKQPRKRGATLRPSAMRIRLRTASLGKVNELSAKLRALGLTDVRTGKEIPISGRTGSEAVYHFDASIEAEIPLRGGLVSVERFEDAFEEGPDVEAAPDISVMPSDGEPREADEAPEIERFPEVDEGEAPEPVSEPEIVSPEPEVVLPEPESAEPETRKAASRAPERDEPAVREPAPRKSEPRKPKVAKPEPRDPDAGEAQPSDSAEPSKPVKEMHRGGRSGTTARPRSGGRFLRPPRKPLRYTGKHNVGPSGTESGDGTSGGGGDEPSDAGGDAP